MTKENLQKITQPFACWDINDISAEEKKYMLSVLEKHGFTISTFYLRFFQKGFSQWEIDGANECKNQFLHRPDVAEKLLNYVDPDDKDGTPGDKGYFYTLAQSDAPGVFYDCLRKANAGLCMQFVAFMGERGMSPGTVTKRFTSDEWKEWERVGIAATLEQFLK